MTAALRRARSSIREMSWSYLLGLAFFILVSGIVLAIGADKGSARAGIKILARAAIASLFIARLLSGGYGGLDRWRAAATWPSRLAGLLPSLLTGWMRMDRANLRACTCWLARRAHTARPPGMAFGFGKRSSYSTYVLVALFSTLIDLPLNGFIASVVVRDPLIQNRIHVLCGALAVYSLVWILGDRWLMQGSSHVLGETTLDLKIAARLTAQIPLTAIAACEAISDGAAWRQRHAVARNDTLTATPADAPNIVLTIADYAAVPVVHWQVERRAPRYLFLYVDEPSGLAAALGEAIAR